MNRHLPVHGRFVSGVMERKDEPLFPPLALREALVNALCHRDYSIVGGAISIAVFDDRLEIKWLWDLGDVATAVSSDADAWEDRVKGLRRKHSRKPSLMKRFDKAGFP